MRIHLAADSSGYAIGRGLEASLSADGHEVLWHAAPEQDEGDDYPLYAVRVGKAVIADEDAGITTRGVLVGAYGTGEVIAANKVAGARAVHALSTETVIQARTHSDANVLTLGAHSTDEAAARDLVAAFLETGFSNVLDDARRIVNINEFESLGTIEGWNIDPAAS